MVRSFTERALENVRFLLGVKAVGLTIYLPFSGNNNSSVITIVGRALGPGEDPPVPGFGTIDSGYFRVIGIPLLQGRIFEESDTAEAQRVVVIDQFLARQYWPDTSPIGAKIRNGVDSDNPMATIVGVVGSVKISDLVEQNPVGAVYFYYKQNPTRRFHLVFQGERGESAITTAARNVVQKLDAELPLFDIETMRARLEDSLMARRPTMILSFVFAVLALVLWAIGIYGVLAYAVTQRTREFGIRLSLGAQGGDVLRMVLAQGLKLAAAGLIVGVLGAYWVTRLMTSLLFEVRPSDPAVFVLVSVLLGAVALLASLIPSLRATRIDPIVALRYE